ncbi:MAG: DNA/RNA non-specific endonuclease [Lachnospiraceae bacterium]|nr:DNA/RNA non-specific endonuclease [Lachnospiraceae bacterium]
MKKVKWKRKLNTLLPVLSFWLLLLWMAGCNPDTSKEREEIQIEQQEAAALQESESQQENESQQESGFLESDCQQGREPSQETDFIGESEYSLEVPALEESDSEGEAGEKIIGQEESFSLKDIPVFVDFPYVIVHGNKPFFTEEELTTSPFEFYASLDELGRCGITYANICVEIMPTEERGEIGMIKPSGWQTAKYDFVDGKYLYNRCHLIGYQLSGENDNTRNLITGTRYLNVRGMLPFEEQVAKYVQKTDNHVLYRVTPIFEGNNLLATGVLMEAMSVEDVGEGVCFCVFCYNAQPGVIINYADGTNASDGSQEALLAEKDSDVLPVPERLPDQPSMPDSDSSNVPDSESTPSQPVLTCTYVINTNTGKFHYPNCSSVGEMAEHNKLPVDWDREKVIAEGYVPCKRCNP